jgi:hypothetical protein
MNESSIPKGIIPIVFENFEINQFGISKGIIFSAI